MKKPERNSSQFINTNDNQLHYFSIFKKNNHEKTPTLEGESYLSKIANNDYSLSKKPYFKAHSSEKKSQVLSYKKKDENSRTQMSFQFFPNPNFSLIKNENLTKSPPKINHTINYGIGSNSSFEKHKFNDFNSVAYVNAMKALQNKIKSLETYIEKFTEEKEIFIKNTEKEFQIKINELLNEISNLNQYENELNEKIFLIEKENNEFKEEILYLEKEKKKIDNDKEILKEENGKYRKEIKIKIKEVEEKLINEKFQHEMANQSHKQVEDEKNALIEKFKQLNEKNLILENENKKIKEDYSQQLNDALMKNDFLQNELSTVINFKFPLNKNKYNT